MPDLRRVAGLVASAGLLLTACTLLPVSGSKGTMPPPGANGEIDPSAVPDFVAVAGNEGVVGYVAKDAVLGGATDQTWPVYADDLRTVVGHMVEGRGFVPIGVDPAAVPTFEVRVGPVDPNATPQADQVLVYVRNASPVEAWIVVMTGAEIMPAGGGFPADGYMGVWCGHVPPGSRLVLLDRSAVDANAKPKQTVYFGAEAAGAVSRFLDVAPDGTAVVGDGVPAWWLDGDPPC